MGEERKMPICNMLFFSIFFVLQRFLLNIFIYWLFTIQVFQNDKYVRLSLKWNTQRLKQNEMLEKKSIYKISRIHEKKYIWFWFECTYR